MEEITINQISIGICLFIVFLAVVDLSSTKETHRDMRALIVTTGIFGTFLGIYLGLQDFDTQNIEASVPPLLEGMKTAFLTSVFGMGSSIGITLYRAISHNEAPSELNTLGNVDSKLDKLISINESGFENTQKSLREAIEQLAQGASAEIIKALEDVIQDFNTNLKEQFGENFKQLNLAVEKLLTWQQNYADQVENNESMLGKATELLGEVVHVCNDSVEGAKHIKTAIDSVLKVTEQIEDQSSQTAGALEAQKLIVQELEKSFTVFKSSMEATSSATSQLTDDIKKSLTSQSESLNQLTGNIRERLPESLGQLEKTLTGLTNRFAEDYQRFLQAVASLNKAATRE